MRDCLEWLETNLRNGWGETLATFVVEHRCSLGDTLFMECQEELKRYMPEQPHRAVIGTDGGAVRHVYESSIFH